MNNQKLYKPILNYFKIINPLPYDEVTVNYIERWERFSIDITVSSYEEQTDYTRSEGMTKYQLQKISEEMTLMFPYKFSTFCRVRKI